MDLKGVEIFSVGRWNDIKNFTEADLDNMAASFSSLGLSGRVPLKLGHNDEQAVTDGQPALGWVQRVYREGERLLADFTSMPRVVYDAVRQGLYKFVSVELLRDAIYQGSEFPWVLSAVSLLGADIPAVGNLKDLQALTLSRVAGFRHGARLTFTRASTNGESNHMEPGNNLAALTAKVDGLVSKVEKLTSDNATLTAENSRLKSEADSTAKQIRKEKVDNHRKAIGERFDAAIRKKLILPSTRAMFERDPAFKSDDSVTDITLEFVDSYIKERHVAGAVDRGEADDTGTDNLGSDRAGEAGMAPDEKLVFRTNKRLATDQRFKGASYYSAQMYELKADPELAEAYRNQPGIKGGKAA